MWNKKGELKDTKAIIPAKPINNLSYLSCEKIIIMFFIV